MPIAFCKGFFRCLFIYFRGSASVACFQKSKTTTAIEENLRDRYLDETFDTHIRNSVVVMGKSFMDGPLPANSRNSIAVKDYRAVANEILEVIG